MNETPADPFKTEGQILPAQVDSYNESDQSELWRIQHEAKDVEHLNLIAVFHYVWGGLVGFGALGCVAYMFFMEKFFRSALNMASTPIPATVTTPSEASEVVTAVSTAPYPSDMIDNMIQMMYVVYGVLAALCIIGCICNIISGRCIHKKKNRVFSMVVGAFNCIMFPLGTVLGVFTFVVLCRNSVAQMYGRGLHARQTEFR